MIMRGMLIPPSSDISLPLFMSTDNEEVSGLGLRLSKGEDKISLQHDSLAALFPGAVLAPLFLLLSPLQKGRRRPCTRPWQQGVHGSCTHLCQGQIKASLLLGKNLNRVLYVMSSLITLNRGFSLSRPLPFLLMPPPLRRPRKSCRHASS